MSNLLMLKPIHRSRMRAQSARYAVRYALAAFYSLFLFTSWFLVFAIVQTTENANKHTNIPYEKWSFHLYNAAQFGLVVVQENYPILHEQIACNYRIYFMSRRGLHICLAVWCNHLHASYTLRLHSPQTKRCIQCVRWVQFAICIYIMQIRCSGFSP